MDDRISLAHGNGGRFMRELIDDVFAKSLEGLGLDTDVDAAAMSLSTDEYLLTTDGFTVQPLEFPGGNIGSLAVHGTTNDLAVAGAKPLYLTLNAFIEEGFEISVLQRIIESLATAARASDVKIIAGDTKVLRRGEGGGLYLATTGVGIRIPGVRPSMRLIEDTDRIIVSGPVGDHGTAVMLAREQFGLRGTLSSDAASVYDIASTLMQFDGLRFMRDPTRGGIASVANEIVRATGLGVRLHPNIPVRQEVQSVCDMLGYDPLYLACEGRLVAVIAAHQADDAVEQCRTVSGGQQSVICGRITSSATRVILETEIGGERFLEELEDDPLPRIC